MFTMWQLALETEDLLEVLHPGTSFLFTPQMIISHNDAVILVLASGTVKAEIKGNQSISTCYSFFKNCKYYFKDFPKNFPKGQ